VKNDPIMIIFGTVNLITIVLKMISPKFKILNSRWQMDRIGRHIGKIISGYNSAVVVRFPRIFICANFQNLKIQDGGRLPSSYSINQSIKKYFRWPK